MVRKGIELPQVIGRNVRKFRGDHTLEDVALSGHGFGAGWSSGSISAIEQGRFKATVETLALLSLSLTYLRGQEYPEIRIGDLLETDLPIELNATMQTDPDSLIQWLGGGRLDAWLSPGAMHVLQKKASAETERIKGLHFPPEWVIDTGRGGPITTGEKRLAKRASIDPYELRAWSLHLWGKALEDHRDEIAGPDSTPQKKGRVSRDLLQEVEAAMKENHGDD